jgi:hypothetical membrane protein
MSDKLGRVFKPEIASLLGALAPVCAAVSLGVSIMLSPWFSWTHNALSDLGVSGAAPIFNSGLMVTGILIAIFAVSLARAEDGSRLNLAGAASLIVMGVSIVGVGVFTEEFTFMHTLFSLITFVLLIVSSILFGIHFISSQETRILGVLALPSGILSIIVWFAVKTPGLAIKEALTAIPAFGWYIALAVRTRISVSKS